MPEWLMGVDCKSAGYTYVGSNPTRPNINKLLSKQKKSKALPLFQQKIK